jgi:hypothetical protein
MRYVLGLSSVDVFYSWNVAVSVAIVDELDAEKEMRSQGGWMGWMYAETEPIAPQRRPARGGCQWRNSPHVAHRPMHGSQLTAHSSQLTAAGSQT